MNEYNFSFVLLTCDERYADSVIEELRSISNVTDVRHVQGMYDILVQIKEQNETIKELIRTKIRYIQGVRSTLTLFGVS